MNRVSSMVRNGWFLCTQRGALNLDPAALKHYKACLARIKPLIDSGKVDEAKETFYSEITSHPGTAKLSLFAVQQFAWNPSLKDPESLRNFLEILSGGSVFQFPRRFRQGRRRGGGGRSLFA